MVRIVWLAVLVACGPSTRVAFKPRDAAAALPPALVDRAVLAYRDDAEVLAAADAAILGSLEIEGSSSAEAADLRGRAIVEGARLGGTHVLVAAERSAEEWDQISANGTRRWGDGDSIRSQSTEGVTVNREIPQGLFVVIRISRERWRDLPAPLRPE